MLTTFIFQCSSSRCFEQFNERIELLLAEHWYTSITGTTKSLQEIACVFKRKFIWNKKNIERLFSILEKHNVQKLILSENLPINDVELSNIFLTRLTDFCKNTEISILSIFMNDINIESDVLQIVINTYYDSLKKHISDVLQFTFHKNQISVHHDICAEFKTKFYNDTDKCSLHTIILWIIGLEIYNLIVHDSRRYARTEICKNFHMRRLLYEKLTEKFEEKNKETIERKINIITGYTFGNRKSLFYVKNIGPYTLGTIMRFL